MEEDYYTSDGSVEEDDSCSFDQEDEPLDGLESDENWLPRKAPSSKVITRESLLAAQRKDMRTVMELLSVREHHARTLLIHYRWDVERLTAVYVEKGRLSMFSEAGVMVEIVDLDPPEPSTTVMCNICIDDVPAKDITKMDCGHDFCNSCWTEHFIVKINDGQSKRIRCMAHKCNAICDEAVVRNLVSAKHPDLAEKFDRFLLESYIEDNKMVKWCPSMPHCGNAIRVEDATEVCEVECFCGMQFCFGCSSEAHSPCSCSMWQLWTKKCRDESETVNWITVHTKSCPKCHKLVEKNGGCNLVSCICGQPFCWLCGGATGRDHTWTTIAHHSCGRYKEDREKKTESAKKQLYRYMHYHNRYKAHTDSFKQECKLTKTIKEKITKLEKEDWTLKDFSWLTNGIHRLFRSRRALSYSYPFAYYMFGNEFFKEEEMTKKECEIKQNLFEDQQQQLESNVEKLSKFLEEPLDEYVEEQVVKTRMQVINLCVTTDSLCRKMYECIENDLLGSLRCSIHSIAPYQSKGIEKAEELNVGETTAANCNSAYKEAAGQSTGEVIETSASASNKLSSRKRARKGGSAGIVID